MSWVVQRRHSVVGLTNGAVQLPDVIYKKEGHGGYDKKVEDVIAAAKIRCEEEDLGGFVVANSVTQVLHTGLCTHWPSPLECEVYFLTRSFRAGDAVEKSDDHSESSSGVRQTQTTYDLHFRCAEPF